ncbi:MULTISPECIES: hypothetical protein [unclassified Neisseria]|uniref:hypothetical protein n=1 Tax=unclassified Neisseria TaxID=2623750 RepID=UPI002664FF01|nr:MULTISPECIES: hypothetical protein [unclassified Neisseria]MDO1510217.1 hypothetical protein [Neisseria sp. MVDL19-042950]MDO1516386.1 hypothetical protein [Neisseria sp. MVDL18-041461]MDO1563534.1 hypothetical protein [Neisseria sp. MVDL20-010259]
MKRGQVGKECSYAEVFILQLKEDFAWKQMAIRFIPKLNFSDFESSGENKKIKRCLISVHRKKPEQFVQAFKSGSPTWARTRDLRINRPKIKI